MSDNKIDHLASLTRALRKGLLQYFEYLVYLACFPPLSMNKSHLFNASSGPAGEIGFIMGKGVACNEQSHTI